MVRRSLGYRPQGLIGLIPLPFAGSLALAPIARDKQEYSSPGKDLEHSLWSVASL
jgi:hypothetical protein